ncbi:MAG: glycosyltransferase family 2 protein [Methanothrix sp.]
MPIVSVIISTYNRAYLVGRAIRSVLDQTYQDFELIVVDDGSADNTDEVVKGFNDLRIRYIRHEQNKGSAAARNTGINAAQGEYIAFQDSDDEWLPEKLEKQMRIFEMAPAQVGVVYTGFYLIKGDRKTYIPDPNIKITEGNIHSELLKRNFVGTPSAVVRKRCFKKVGMFDERLPSLEDWELFIRISEYYTFSCINEPLLNAFFSPGSISTNKDAHHKAFKLILEKHIRTFKRNRYLLASMQYMIGNRLCQAGDMREGKEYLLQALRTNPLNIKYLVVVLVSLFGEDAYANVVMLKRIIRPVDKA